MKHVFISYKREDVVFVNELEQRLKQADVDVWTDAQIQAGENWRSKIDEAINDSFSVIVVMTPEARKSEYVTYEWAFAMGVGKAIVPLIIKNTEVHPKLFDVQHIDFTDIARRDWDKLVTTMKALDPQSYSQQDVPRSVRQAVDNLDNLDRNTREQALAALEMMAPHPAAINALGKAVNHIMLDVRQMAGNAIERITSIHNESILDSIVPELQTAMDDYDTRVQAVALASLSNIGGDEVLKYIWDITKSNVSYDDYEGFLHFEESLQASLEKILKHKRFTEISADTINQMCSFVLKETPRNYSFCHSIIHALSFFSPVFLIPENIEILTEYKYFVPAGNTSINVGESRFTIKQSCYAVFMQLDREDINKRVLETIIADDDIYIPVLRWLQVHKRTITHLVHLLFEELADRFYEAFVQQTSASEAFLTTKIPINIGHLPEILSIERLLSAISTEEAIDYLKDKATPLSNSHTFRYSIRGMLENMDTYYSQKALDEL